jgi:hypothetical protein
MATPKKTPGISDIGRLHEIQEQAAAESRGPYVLTEDIIIEPLTRRQARTMRAAKSEAEQLEILLGGNREAIEELFDDRDLKEWIIFQKNLQAHFYGPGASELPGGSTGS